MTRPCLHAPVTVEHKRDQFTSMTASLISFPLRFNPTIMAANIDWYGANSRWLSLGLARMIRPKEPQIVDNCPLDQRGGNDDHCFCIQCACPHVVRYCDLTTETVYRTCDLHLEKCVNGCFRLQEEANRYSSPLRHQQANAENFRECIGDPGMAIVLAFSQARVAGGEAGIKARFHDMVDNPRAVGDAVDDMLWPKKTHKKGCMRSSQPESIICTTGGDDDGTTKLATDIYFKRCDGSFKNIAGKVLEVDADSREDGKHVDEGFKISGEEISFRRSIAAAFPRSLD